MPFMIRKFDNRNQPIVDIDSPILPDTYFNLLKLDQGQKMVTRLDHYETVYVVLRGSCDITVSGQVFNCVGSRNDIWSGKADSVYATVGAEVTVIAADDGTEIAVAGGRYDKELPAFRIFPKDTVSVDVGSNETKSHRVINHITGSNTKGKTGNLLVSELYADEGCWAGYPPHKHDEELGAEETAFEEVYYYRFDPQNGFGVQVTFQTDDSSECFMVRDRDIFLIDKGYHPVVTTPGHRQYIFTILTGKHGSSLIQNFKKEYRYLMDKIPGISEMRSKFK